MAAAQIILGVVLGFLSVGLAFLIRLGLRKFFHKEVHVVILAAICLVVLGLATRIPSLIEKHQKSNFKIATSNPYIQIDSVTKSFSPTGATISFNVTASQGGDYLFMSGIAPCHRLDGFNAQPVTDRLPTLNLNANNPTTVVMSFKKVCNETPYSLHIDLSPKSQGVDLGGWARVSFTSDYKELRERAWIGTADKSVLTIYLPDLDLNN